MKKVLFAIVLFFSSCQKVVSDVFSKKASTTTSPVYTKYTILAGDHYCSPRSLQAVSTSEIKFIVKFDQSAIYTSPTIENQYDINKLWGSTDNADFDAHKFSTRIGWRYSDGQLRLFGYIYNNGVRSEQEIKTVEIGKDINCSIRAEGTKYIFTVDGVSVEMPRTSTTSVIKGYRQYPYFGGDDVAPHTVTINIQSL